MDLLPDFSANNYQCFTHTYVPQNFQLYHQGQLLKSEKIAERMSETIGITRAR